ncbi:hypothetical protein [Halobacterium yunchengense]|uniref:hypothetical protein n=1 Tax=Halobacterium yunchengense TaxID=3108497 RepID=UPI0030084B3B
MRPTTDFAPADAHDLPTTVAAALVTVALLFAAVVAVAAPATALTVAGTVAVVLGAQRLTTAYRTRVRERTLHRANPAK